MLDAFRALSCWLKANRVNHHDIEIIIRGRRKAVAKLDLSLRREVEANRWDDEKYQPFTPFWIMGIKGGWEVTDEKVRQNQRP